MAGTLPRILAEEAQSGGHGSPLVAPLLVERVTEALGGGRAP